MTSREDLRNLQSQQAGSLLKARAGGTHSSTQQLIAGSFMHHQSAEVEECAEHCDALQGEQQGLLKESTVSEGSLI